MAAYLSRGIHRGIPLSETITFNKSDQLTVTVTTKRN